MTVPNQSRPTPTLQIGKVRITGAVARLLQIVILGGIVVLLVWQRPSIGMLLSGGIWLGFMTYWAALARTPAPTVKAESRAASVKHGAWREIGLLLLLIPLPWLNGSILPTALWHVPVGLAVQLAGAWLYLRGKRELGRQWSSAISIKADHQLIRTGPYRFVRHPMYTAMITMAAGTAIVSTRVHAAIGVALVTWSYLVKISVEERWLREEFGAAHDEYRRTSWKLLPPIY